MKLILCILLIQLLSSFNVYSQTSKVDSFINKNKIKLSETYPSVSGQKYSFTKEQFVYTIKFVQRQIEIYRFDTKTNEINKTPPDDVIPSKEISLLTVAEFGEKYMILYRKLNNSDYATPYVITKNDEIGSHKFLKLKLNKETVIELRAHYDYKSYDIN